MNNTQKKRLLKLANHLISNEPLGVKVFNFEVMGAKGSGKNCGCAMGETTYMWDGWYSSGMDNPHYEDLEDTYESLQSFFGLTEREVDHLFQPSAPCKNYQETAEFGGEVLYAWATREQVGQNMLAFLEKKEKQ